MRSPTKRPAILAALTLVGLGERDDALGRVWHLPSPETGTTREVVALVYRAAGTDRIEGATRR